MIAWWPIVIGVVLLLVLAVIISELDERDLVKRERDEHERERRLTDAVCDLAELAKERERGDDDEPPTRQR